MKADKKMLKSWVRQQNRANRPATMMMALMGMFNVLVGMVLIWSLATILAEWLTGGDRINRYYLLLFILSSVVRVILGYGQELLAMSSGEKARKRLRRELLARFFAQGPALLRHQHSAALAAMLTDRVEALEGYFSRWLPASALWVVAQWSVVLVVFWQNHRAGLILGGCCLFLPVFQAVFGIATAIASRRQILALNRLQVRFLDRIRGIATIVLSGSAEKDAQGLGRAADELRQRTMKVLRIAFLTSASTDVAMIVALVWIVVDQRHGLLHAGSIPQVTSILFAVLMVPEAFAPFRALSAAYQDRAQITNSGEAIQRLPNLPEWAKNEASAHPVPQRKAQGITLDVQGVSYRWVENRPLALDNVSFHLDAGDVALLTGSSGAGKSTLIEMLLGFIRPSQGKVLLGGIDLQDMRPADVTRQISWIGQKPVIFAGTLRDNILFASPDASEEQLQAALEASSVMAYLPHLPDGLDTKLGEGGFGLSGGQAQRIAIARAFLKDAPLLIMDEPTAHLDPATEQEILVSLRDLLKGRTALISTHSSQFHKIGETKRLVIKKGQITAEEVLS
ncbi:thiol reductant ABC exporter subunit CydD [Bombella sp. TMW 2.2559]|uniref:Thiol reductant ABC exporter subunit CydD n=1 Tax=Bombella dulcis TaxID=2967339 RepID=A0ABT3W9H8_9PROT|nr:thiol reductant ABC exporter subunit CydD [Bombella dulcis]MCX5615744.1 thiol reductant ABC exporter subunit CydD [Bombella dulcis]